MNFDKKYETDKFVTNETNLRSYMLARLLGKGKCTKRLILFQGSYGNGKTHLMKMIMQELEEKQFKVNYMEAFQYHELLYNWVMFPYEIMDEMESIQFLIMEDVDVLDGKIIWQKRLANFLRTMIRQNKQIVLTSNKPMIEMDDTLKQLLSEAHMEQIKEPDAELKRKALKEWVKEVTCEVPEQILKMISDASLSIGKMSSVWYVLKFLHIEAHESLNKELVEWVLNEMCYPDEKRELQVVDLLFHEAKYSDSQIAEMLQIKEEFVKEKREDILKRYPVWNNWLCIINDEYVVLAKFWGAEMIEGHKVEEIEEYNHITEERRKNILKRIHLESRQLKEG